MLKDVDLVKYELLRQQFGTIRYRMSKPKVGKRVVKVIETPSMKEILLMENHKR